MLRALRNEYILGDCRKEFMMYGGVVTAVFVSFSAVVQLVVVLLIWAVTLFCSVAIYVAISGQYKAVQLLKLLFTNIYKHTALGHAASVRPTSVSLSLSLSDHFPSLSPSGQCRSGPTLYTLCAVRQIRRANGLTNWQCISQAAKSF